MGARRFRVADLPFDARIEVWGDNTVWIVLVDGTRSRLLDWVMDKRETWHPTNGEPIK